MTYSMWDTVSQDVHNFSKSHLEISHSHHEVSHSHPMSDLDLLDILLGANSRQNNNNNAHENALSNVKRSDFSRHRTTSCNSVVMDDFQSSNDGVLERWEPGEILDRSSPFCQTNQFLRETVSEPGTPNKMQVC